jgi:hypothetical protein
MGSQLTLVPPTGVTYTMRGWPSGPPVTWAW